MMATPSKGARAPEAVAIGNGGSRWRQHWRCSTPLPKLASMTVTPGKSLRTTKTSHIKGRSKKTKKGKLRSHLPLRRDTERGRL